MIICLIFHVTPHLNRQVDTVQMRGHDICFYAESTKIIPNHHQILPYLELCGSGINLYCVFHWVL